VTLSCSHQAACSRPAPRLSIILLVPQIAKEENGPSFKKRKKIMAFGFLFIGE
jgi:hypothetical protein